MRKLLLLMAALAAAVLSLTGCRSAGTENSEEDRNSDLTEVAAVPEISNINTEPELNDKTNIEPLSTITTVETIPCTESETAESGILEFIVTIAKESDESPEENTEPAEETASELTEEICTTAPETTADKQAELSSILSANEEIEKEIRDTLAERENTEKAGTQAAAAQTNTADSSADAPEDAQGVDKDGYYYKYEEGVKYRYKFLGVWMWVAHPEEDGGGVTIMDTSGIDASDIPDKDGDGIADGWS